MGAKKEKYGAQTQKARGFSRGPSLALANGAGEGRAFTTEVEGEGSNNTTKTLSGETVGGVYTTFCERLQTLWFAAVLHQIFFPMEGGCGRN